MIRYLAVPLAAAALLFSNGGDAKAATVNCNSPNASIQREVDRADGPTTIQVRGTCFEDVLIEKDDITLSGGRDGAECDRELPGGDGTIEGTVTVKRVRARIEFLTVTGPGQGVHVTDRATAELHCNDISDNQETGITVYRSSHARLTGNRVSGNGARTASPYPYFDCGLYIADASAVESLGNTYADNQYCAIEADRQSVFRNGPFVPSGQAADPDQIDVIIERGCDVDSGAGCFTSEQDRVAIEMFNGGLVDLRNARVGGEMDVIAQSSLRLDGNVEAKGNVRLDVGSIARIRNRNQPGHTVSFAGSLVCTNSSQAYYSHVLCGQTCDGSIPGGCGGP